MKDIIRIVLLTMALAVPICRADITVDNTLKVDEGFSNFSSTTEAKPYISAIEEFENGDLLVASSRVKKYKGKSISALVRIDRNGNLVKSFQAKLTAQDKNFSPYIETMLIHKIDGVEKILITGYFRKVNGVIRNNMARLNADGSVDESFDPGTGPDSTIEGSAHFYNGIYVNGRYILPGQFIDRFNSQVVTGTLVLDTDANIVINFPTFPGDYHGEASYAYLDGDGFILTGSFYDGDANVLADAAQIMRFNSDGTIDNSFDYTLTTKTVNGDNFDTFTGGALSISSTAYTFVSQSPVGEDRSNLIRVLKDGSYDTSLNLTLRNGERLRGVFVVDPNDPASDIIIAGMSSKPFIRRINSDGSSDSSLGLNKLYSRQNDIYDSLVDINGDFVVAGNFARKVGRKPFNTLVRIKAQ